MDNIQTNELQLYQNDNIWLNDNYKILIQKYPDQWIAVKNKTVIASAPDFYDLLSKLTDSVDVVVEFITCEPLGMVL